MYISHKNNVIQQIDEVEWRRLSELVGAWLRRVERSKYRGRAARELCVSRLLLTSKRVLYVRTYLYILHF